MTVLIVIGLWLTASVLVSLLIGRAISVMGEDAIVTTPAESKGPVRSSRSEKVRATSSG
jgi:hypothetical protein